MSADTCASLRPTSGMSPRCSCAATRSAAAPAATSAAISSESLAMRNGPTTSTERENSRPGRCDSSSTKNLAHIWSPIATRRDAPMSRAVIATGSSVSFHATSSNTPGSWVTRAASRRGTTSVAARSVTTSAVRRSSGIAWYPTRYGRSNPTDTTSASTMRDFISARTRARRREYNSAEVAAFGCMFVCIFGCIVGGVGSAGVRRCARACPLRSRGRPARFLRGCS